MPLESVEEFGNRWRDRAIEAESENKRLRAMYDAVSAREHDLIEERDELRAQANLDRPAQFQLRGTEKIRAEALREAADALGRMDYDTDSSDYGYDTYRDAWDGGVMDGAALLRRMAGEQPAQDEAEAAGTLARECTDHASVILWCADRVRSVDDDPAVQDAADYLHSLSTRAQVDAASVPNRPAIIRECAQEVHSMGGDGDVERAAEYLDDLATEAEEEEST
jgi:hypothetical protein